MRILATINLLMVFPLAVCAGIAIGWDFPLGVFLALSAALLCGTLGFVGFHWDGNKRP